MNSHSKNNQQSHNLGVIRRIFLSLSAYFSAMVLLILVDATAVSARAQGSAFTYQGRLNSAAGPANGLYDFQFTLYDIANTGNSLGNAQTNAAVAVVNGLFTVMLDFGNQFTGADRWLEIAVRTNGGAGFILLAPRQPLTPAPYAVTAANVVGPINGSSIASGTIGSGQLATGAVTTVNLAAGAITPSLLASNIGVWLQSGPDLTYGAGNVGIGTGDPHAKLQVGGTLIGGGSGNTIAPGLVASTIAGGGSNPDPNGIQSENCFIGAGTANQIFGGADRSFIGAGTGNSIESTFGAVSGGFYNLISANSVVSVIGGGSSNTIRTNSPFSVIGGGDANNIGANSLHSFIGGGNANTISDDAQESVIGGGFLNQVGTNSWYAFMGGGAANSIGPNSAYAVVSGGDGNLCGAPYAVVPGGLNNAATGQTSLAAGKGAKAMHNGAFVWADQQLGDFASSAPNQFLVRAGGGVGINVSNPEAPLHVKGTGETLILGADAHAGAHTALSLGLSAASGGYGWMQAIQYSGSSYGNLSLNPNGGKVCIGDTNPATLLDVRGTITCVALNQTSDRHLKRDFASVTPAEILAKVVALPISEWSYQSDQATRHIGPMAQDFHAAFRVGTDDRHIATVDEGGVALAAIQGLNQKVEEKDAQIRDLREQNASLVERLSALEEVFRSQSNKH